MTTEKKIDMGQKENGGLDVPEIVIQELLSLYNNGEFSRSLTSSLTALENYNSSSILYNIVGASYAGLEDYENAIKNYKKSIGINPNYKEAYNNLGNALRASGKIEAAIKNYQKAIYLDPNFAQAYSNLGVIYTDLNILKAIECYQLAIKLDPRNPNYYLKQGNLYLSINKFNEAQYVYLKALRIKPKFAAVLSNLGNIYFEKNEFNSAIECYQKAVNTDPSLASAYYNMGNSWREKDNIDLSVECYKKTIALNSDHLNAYINCADIYEKWNKIKELGTWLRYSERKLKNFPPDLQVFKCIYLFRNKKYSECMKLMTKIHLHDLSGERKATFLEYKAKCYEKLEDYANAFQYFSQKNQLIEASEIFKLHEPDLFFERQQQVLSKLETDKTRMLFENVTHFDRNCPVFIIGFPRSGTTLLDSILRSHNSICVYEEVPAITYVKEKLTQISELDYITEFPNDENRKYGHKLYFELLAKAQPCNDYFRVQIDKMPLNLLDLPFINFLFPNAKYIMVQRHPLDAILSCWMQNFKLNNAMANLVDLERTFDFFQVAMSIYLLSKEKFQLNIYTLRYENLVHDMQYETNNLLEFLGLKWENQMKDFNETAKKRGKIHTPSYSQVVQPLYTGSIYKWEHYKNYLKPYFSKVETLIKHFGYTF